MLIYDCIAYEHKVVEGATWVALTEILKTAHCMQVKKLEIVVCGNNIGSYVILNILSTYQGRWIGDNVILF